MMKLDGDKLLKDLDDKLSIAICSDYGSFSSSELIALENATDCIKGMIQSGDYTIEGE